MTFYYIGMAILFLGIVGCAAYAIRFFRGKVRYIPLVDYDFPKFDKFSEEMRRMNIDFNSRFRGSVREAMGLYLTDDEFEVQERESLGAILK